MEEEKDMTDKGKVRIPVYLDLKAVEVPFIESLDRKQARQVIEDIDCEQADLDFTVEVVTDLAVSVAEEVAADETEVRLIEVAGYGNRMMSHPDQIVQALAAEPPARIVEIMGRALAEARKMAAGAAELMNSSCQHDPDCGCSDAQVELDLNRREIHAAQALGTVTVESGPNTDWTTPRGIQRLEKLVKEQAQRMCDGCGHVLSAHNGGEAYNVCLPGFPNEGCMACTMNEKEK